MAKMTMSVPRELMRDFEKLHDNAGEIFGKMTQAGAEAAMQNIIAGSPTPELRQYVKQTRVYRTPTDDGINTKVYFSGYMPFKGNRKTFSRRNREGGKMYTTDKGVPADFVAQVYEYGRSGNPFPKKPFVRKAFRKKNVEEAMHRAFREATGVSDDE